MFCQLLYFQFFLITFYHFFIFCISQFLFTWIHSKYAAPFILIPVLRNQMELKVMSGISVCTIVYLVWMEQVMHGLCYLCDIFHKCAAFLCCQFDDLTHMLLMSNNVILSILVDTFISKISLPMQPVPEIGSISVA